MFVVYNFRDFFSAVRINVCTYVHNKPCYNSLCATISISVLSIYIKI